MYLVSSDQFRDTKQLAQPPPPPTSMKNKPSRKQKQQPKTSIKKKKKASRKQPPRHKHKKKKTRVIEKLHPLDKWIAYRKKIEESAVKRETLMKEITKFLGRVLPKNAPLQSLPIKPEPHVRTPLDN